jgi:aldehyde dehydrogenase (NAD+)
MMDETHHSIIPGKENRLTRLPLGVVGVISPWNFPFHLTMRSVVAALATGNGVVLKPATLTYITGGLIIGEIFEEAGIPKGLLNVVVGAGSEIGDYFVEHPIPRMISFTGSTEVGERIGSLAGGKLKKTALELGGNCAFIVLDDADINQAASAAVFGKFTHQGQICMAINRIIVDRKVYPEFVQTFKEKVSKLKAGDPMDPTTDIGPLIERRQVDGILRLVDKAVTDGAHLELEGFAEGNLVTPFILTEVTNDMEIAQNEIFGPVAVIIPVDSEAEAIKVANDSAHGLSCSVFTSNFERGVQAAGEIHSGMVHINDQTVNDEPHIPFGGEKASGLGRFNGEFALEEFTTVKWISVQREARLFPY